MTDGRLPAAMSAAYCLGRVEKYRPQKLSEVVGNDDAVQRLRSIATDGNMPHMILTVGARQRADAVLSVAALLLAQQLHQQTARRALTTAALTGLAGYRKDDVRHGTCAGNAGRFLQGRSARAQCFG